jgi:hypothetical protein
MIPRDGPIDITDPPVFTVLASVCITVGLFLGYMCAWMFYEVSHPVIWNGARATATEIPPMYGAAMIVILAATGLLIALTATYVPRWVREYYEQGRIPGWVLRVYSWCDETLAFLKEKS